MPSNRRVKIFGLTIFLIVVFILYTTSNARQSNREFYERTVAAMDAKSVAAASDQDVGQKLKEVEAAARRAAELGIQRKPPEIVMDPGDESAAGRRKMKGGEKWDVSSGKESAVGEREPEVVKTDEEKDVELELNTILKRSPIIIFSKSYCRFSRKAKDVFNKYTIIPAPFVVELDQHQMGTRLQAALQKSTGRSTVPNILINGKSIGGGDDVEALHNHGELIEKVKTMGGKRIMEATLKSA